MSLPPTSEPEADQGGARAGDGSDLEALIQRIRQNLEKAETVSLEEILDAVGTRAYGPLLLVPGLLALAPTGAIPGMSLVTGTLILAVAGQLLLGRPRPWLPRRVLAFTVSRDLLIKAIRRGQPYAKRIDAILRPSLAHFTEFPATRAIALTAIVLALTMYPLALVPFAVAAPSAAVVLFALGLTARDGRVVLAGFACAALAIAAFYYVAL